MKKMLTILALVATASFVFGQEITEIRIDQASSDNDEYFELAGDSFQSLNGLTYIVIGDGAGGSGTIEAVIPLDGYSTAEDGFFAMGEATFTGTCGSLDATGDLNFENSDNVTHMLVSDFTGIVGDDLDTDDDGVLDVTPWTAIIDCVGLKENDMGEQLYCDTIVGPDGTYVPGHVFRCPVGWFIGDFDLCVHDTPGESNGTACAVDIENVTFGELKARFQ